MAVFANLGFELGVAGSPGAAANWSLTATATRLEYAGYSAGTYEDAWDGFELWAETTGWSPGLGSSDAATYGLGLVSPAPAAEAFSFGWSNTVWLTELAGQEAAEYDSAPQAFEDHEEDWDNAAWSTALGPATAASYDALPEAFEDFEEGWATAGWSLGLGATASATYDGVEGVEDFEEVAPPIVAGVDPTANTLVAAAHGISDGTLVRLASTGRAPSGLTTELDYFVVGAATNTLQLSQTVGGSAVDIADPGTGTLTILVDPHAFWNEVITD